MSLRNAFAAVGAYAIGYVSRLRHVAALCFAVVSVSIRPRTWRRTIRDVLARQVLYTGVEATPFTVRLAFLVGLLLVVQVQFWLRKVGQSALLGPIMVAVLVRELGPLLTNMIVILRSGNAIAAEMGHMKLAGEVRVLDAQGLDPFLYLLVPRALGVSLAVLCLTILFLGVSLFSGYLSAWMFGITRLGPVEFLGDVAGAIGPWDVANVLAKAIIPGMLSGTLCCAEGLSVGYAVTDVPQAVTRGVQRSVAALFVTSAIISLITYL